MVDQRQLFYLSIPLGGWPSLQLTKVAAQLASNMVPGLLAHRAVGRGEVVHPFEAPVTSCTTTNLSKIIMNSATASRERRISLRLDVPSTSYSRPFDQSFTGEFVRLTAPVGENEHYSATLDQTQRDLRRSLDHGFVLVYAITPGMSLIADPEFWPCLRISISTRRKTLSAASRRA